MKYNIEVDSETRSAITFALRVRLEQVQEELKHAQKINETIRIEETIAYWRKEIDRTNKALEDVRNNSKMM